MLLLCAVLYSGADAIRPLKRYRVKSPQFKIIRSSGETSMSVPTSIQHVAGPVVDLARSAHAALRPVPLGAVRLEDGFWEPRIRINREVTLRAQLHQCEETGRIDNFRRASGKIEGEFQGIFFNDSDVYKLA